jgi:hypothetical protein
MISKNEYLKMTKYEVLSMFSVIKDFKWLNSHYSELQKIYPNMYVAVKDVKEFGKVYDEARKKGENFIMDYILSGDLFVLI